MTVIPASPHLRVFLRLRHYVDVLVFYLTPSFLQPAQAPVRRPLSATAYLDGLRGVAALIVYIYHYLYKAFPRLKASYSTKETDGWDHHLFWQLPIIRSLHSGRGSVAVFFVISGMVLSLNALTLAHQRNFTQALESLSRSTFRRPFRIFIPIFVITLVSVLLTRFDGVFYIRHRYNFEIPPRENTTVAQVVGWAGNMTELTDWVRFMPAGRHMYKPPYDIFLWTIPIEIKGSLFVFVLLLALLRTLVAVRFAVVGALMIYLTKTGDLDMGLFLVGTMLADIAAFLVGTRSGHEQLTQLTQLTQLQQQQRRSRLANMAVYLGIMMLFTAGLLMLGYPDEDDEKAYGFVWMYAHTPRAYWDNGYLRQCFWHGIGAMLLVTSIVLCPSRGSSMASVKTEYELLPSTSPVDTPMPTQPPSGQPRIQPFLQRPFTSAFAQYLGRISFALYLVQGIIIKTIVARYTTSARDLFEDAQADAKVLMEFGDKDAAAAAADELMAKAWRQYEWTQVTNILLNTLLLFWASDLFYRYVDRHAAGIGRRIAGWCWVSAG